METEKLKKLKSLAALTKLPKEYQDAALVAWQQIEKVNEGIGEVSKKLDELPKEFPAFPEPKEVVFPEVQKVEVLNFPEPKAPIVNIEPPKVEVNVPNVIVPEIKSPDVKVEVDTTGIEQAIEKIKIELPTELTVKLSEEDLSALSEATGKAVKIYGGGGGTPFKTNAKLDEIKTAIENQSNPSYDTLSASSGGYDYLGKATPGTSPSSPVWQIARFDANGSKSYANGSTAFDKDWSARTSYTFTN